MTITITLWQAIALGAAQGLGTGFGWHLALRKYERMLNDIETTLKETTAALARSEQVIEQADPYVITIGRHQYTLDPRGARVVSPGRFQRGIKPND